MHHITFLCSKLTRKLRSCSVMRTDDLATLIMWLLLGGVTTSDPTPSSKTSSKEVIQPYKESHEKKYKQVFFTHFFSKSLTNLCIFWKFCKILTCVFVSFFLHNKCTNLRKNQIIQVLPRRRVFYFSNWNRIGFSVMP